MFDRVDVWVAEGGGARGMKVMGRSVMRCGSGETRRCMFMGSFEDKGQEPAIRTRCELQAGIGVCGMYQNEGA